MKSQPAASAMEDASPLVDEVALDEVPALLVTFIFSYRVPRSKGQLQASCLKIPSKISVKSFPGQNWVVVQVLKFWVLGFPWT